MDTISHLTPEDGIHQFILYESSLQATEMLFTFIRSIWQDHPADETLCIIAEIQSAGQLPVRPALEHIRLLQKQYGRRPCRVAIVSGQPMMDRLFGDRSHTIGFDICFFQGKQSALDWLRSGRVYSEVS